MSGQVSKRSRWTGLTAKVTFACLVNTVLLLLLTYGFADYLAGNAILQHELVDLRDESESRALYLHRKIIDLRNDLLYLRASREVREALADPERRGDAGRYFAERLDDSREDRVFALELGYESEPICLAAFLRAKNGETIVPYRGKPHATVQNDRLASARESYLQRAEGEFNRALAAFQSQTGQHELLLSEIYIDDQTGQQSVWGIAEIAGGEGEPTAGYVGVQLNFSRIARELDQHNRLAMFVADKTGRLYVRPDVDSYKEAPLMSPTHPAHRGEKMQELLPPPEGGDARSQFEAFVGIGDRLESDDRGAPQDEELRFKLLGQKQGPSDPPVAFSGLHRRFLIAYVKPASLDEYYASTLSEMAEDRNKQAWQFNRELWLALDKLRGEHPTLRFPVPSENPNYRYLVTGPPEAMDEAQRILDQFHLKPRAGFGWPSFSTGELATHAMYVTKVPVNDLGANAQLDQSAWPPYLVFGAAASYEEIKADIAHSLEGLGWLLLVAVVLSLIAAVWTWKRVVQPIQQLAEATHVIGSTSGEPAQPQFILPVERRDEIGDLADAFSNMKTRLRENQQLTSSIVRSVAEGIITLDPDRRIYDLNPAAESLFGVSGSHTHLGREYSVLLADEFSRQSFEKLLDDAASGSSPGESSKVGSKRLETKLRLRGKCADNGSEFFMAAAVSRTPVGGKDYYTAIVRDVTEQLNYQAQLEQHVAAATTDLQKANERLERKIGETEAAKFRLSREKQLTELFVSMINHDMNNKLTWIMNAEEYFADSQLDDFAREGLQTITNAAHHLQRLAEESMSFTKLIRGELQLQPTRFDVVELLKMMQRNFALDASLKGTQLVVADPESSCPVFTDQHQLDRILVNLVKNACKFTDNGTITLRARKEQIVGADWAIIDVADTGIGIAEEKMGELFKPFPDILKNHENPDGHGLGLASCSELAKRLGGEITCQSRLGAGSTFTVRIPLKLPEVAGNGDARLSNGRLPAPATQNSYAPAAKSVLVIEDDPAIARLIRERLQQQGFSVEVAHSGNHGLALAKTRSPGVITLDAIMPEMDGWAVLSELKSDPQTSHIPVIMVTVTNDRRRGIALGVSEYFTKPVDWNRLRNVLGRLTGDNEHNRALIIDDEALNRRLCCDALRTRGWVVDEAENGVQGLSAVAKNRPDIILLDLLMPHMDGFEFLERLRAHDNGRSIPVVVITGKHLTEAERSRLSSRVYDVIIKSDHSTERLLEQIVSRVEIASDGEPQHFTEVPLGANSGD